MHETKFETYQKNWLDDLARKRRAKEGKRNDAAKHRQAVATTSERLVEAFKQFTTPPAQAKNVSAMVELKMAALKNDIMQEIGMKMEESSKEVNKDILASILDLL